MSLPATLQPPARASTQARRSVLIDTDLSFDDYVALLFLLQHPSLDVRAITVVSGVVHVRPGLKNLARLLALVNQTSIPIACGPDQPLSGRNDFPAFWRFLMDYVFRLWLPKPPVLPTQKDAPALICQQIWASPSPVTVIALGPLTNLALALRADPAIVNRIESIVVSGGAFTVPGNIQRDRPNIPNTVAEWNFYTDPLAAQEVLESGARIALVPLDVTHVEGASPLVFSPATIRAMRAAVRGKASRLLVDLLALWHWTNPQLSAIPVWDAAVAALVVDPQLGRWKEFRVGIIQQPQAKAGQTYESAEGTRTIQVCFEGNRSAFEATYLALVSGTQERIVRE